MKKTKKLLSILLAMIMVCSTFVIGAQAQYSAYKDAAIGSYDSIDKPRFTAAQLASVALDEIDRMLMELDETSIKVPIINVVIHYSSIDNALNSLENIYNGSVWTTVTSIAGDLANLNFAALNTNPNGNFAANGCRRTTAGKTDLDVLYSVLNFLYDNKNLLASFGYGTLNIGSTLSGLLPSDIMGYFDAANLLKGIIYKAVYEVEAPSPIDKTIDQMAQDIIDKLINQAEDWGAEEAIYCNTFELSGIVNVSNGSFYDIIETALQTAYNKIFVPLANTTFKESLYDLAGAQYTEAQKVYKYVLDDQGNRIPDGNGGYKKTKVGYYLDDTPAILAIRNEDTIYDENAISIYEANEGNFDVFGQIANLQYELEEYDFTGKLFFNELNNILGTWVAVLLTEKDPTFTWENGDNTKLIPNLMGIAKTLLKRYGDRYLSDYITIPSDTEIDALTFESAVIRFGRELVEKFEVYTILPGSANTVRSILSYALLELIADKVPSKDIQAQLSNGTLNPNTDAGWKAIVAVVARYYLNSLTNMNIPDNLNFDQTVAHIVDWAFENYGGILYYTSQIDPNKSAWQKLDDTIFTLIPLNWLPATARVLVNGVESSINITGSEDLIMKVLIGNILDLKIDYLFDIFQRNSSGELNQTISAVLLGRVRSILNAIIPGTMPTAHSTFEGLITAQSFGEIINGLISGINTVKVSLITGALPLVCQILELTADQEIDDPLIVYPDTIIAANRSLGGTSITIRNNSSGVNTGYTDANGGFHQDALYKVKIKSITTNVAGVSVSYTANEQINGGVTKTFPVTGTLANGGLVRFKLTYEILNEMGSSITAEPIDTYFFTYVSPSHADNDKDYYAFDQDGYPLNYVDGEVGSNKHYYVSEPHAYISSWGQLENQTFDLARETTDEFSNLDASVSYVGFTSDMPAGILTGSFETTNTTRGGYYGSKDFAKVTIPKVGDDNADFSDYVGDYTASLTLLATKVNSYDEDQPFTITRNLHLYNDYGLVGLVSNAMSANRQAANYATSGSFPYEEKTEVDGETVTTQYTADAATAWNNYLNALTAAQAIVLKPKTADSFDATAYEPAATALKRAIADLDACAVSAGVASLEALREQYQPSNKVMVNGVATYLKYNDPNYSHFAAEDYVLYTYERYKTHRNRLDSLIDSQKVNIAQPGEDATPEEIEAYEAAYDAAVANIPTLKLFDITYRGHMYEMNAQRLIRVPASKNYLAHAINTINPLVIGLSSADYTAESWAALQAARTFAMSVNNDNSADLRQSKINTARRELISAYKGLELKGSDPADYSQLDEAIAAAEEIFAEENYADKYTGIDELQAAYDAATAVARDLLADDQAIVDEAAGALVAALEALELVEAGFELVAVEGLYDPTPVDEGGNEQIWTPAVKEFEDYVSGYFIDGLLAEMDPGYLDEVIVTSGGLTYEYIPNDNNSSGYIATGDRIVMSDGTEYTTVIYGDVDGTGSIDNEDLTALICMGNWEGEYIDRGGIYTTAADLFYDVDVNDYDLDALTLVLNWEIMVYSFPQDASYGQ